MQSVLLCILVIVLAMDQRGLTGVLHRPIAACTLAGLIFGDPAAGALYGASMELTLCAFEQVSGEMDATGFYIGGIAAVILACGYGAESGTALSTGYIAGILGIMLSSAVSVIAAALLPAARKAAEERKEGTLLVLTVLPSLLRGILFAVIAMLTLQQGTDFSVALSVFMDSYSWLAEFLHAAAYLIPCVGFAVLLRNLSAEKAFEAVILGGILSAILMSLFKESTLPLCALAGFALSMFFVHQSETVSTPAIAEKSSMKTVDWKKPAAKKEEVKKPESVKAEVKQTAEEKAEPVKEEVKAAVEEKTEAVKETVKDVKENVEEKAEEVKETVEEVKETVEEKAEDVIQTVKPSETVVTETVDENEKLVEKDGKKYTEKGDEVWW